MPEDVRGEWTITNFDRAVMNRLSSEFIRYPFKERIENQYRDVPEEVRRRLDRKIRQVDIDCVQGKGKDGRVPVVWQIPEAIYVKYVLPGIRVNRVNYDFDSDRRQATNSGYRYIEPAPDAEEVVLDTPVGIKRGYTEYVKRENAEPVELTYVIEMRARYEQVANDMKRFVFKQMPPRNRLPVRTTKGDVAHFPYEMQAPDYNKEQVSVLQKHVAWSIQYTIDAELDAKPEFRTRPVTDTRQEEHRIEELNDEHPHSEHNG